MSTMNKYAEISKGNASMVAEALQMLLRQHPIDGVTTDSVMALADPSTSDAGIYEFTVEDQRVKIQVGREVATKGTAVQMASIIYSELSAMILPECPKCEDRKVASPDYLCKRCRYG